ncbi:hypothetical protein KIH86_07590 [Paenibacillus sp. HN-1]|nr:hypothetical protein [Paenibacillus sinensis]MBY9081000.1 hypothetical protein [Paenibacillus sp. CGMCC 1.18879]MBY9084102.1 hypothetical protein [Paenibacillus sinensis]
MNFLDLRRRHIAWNISQNPSTITIHRVEKRRKGGGYEQVENDLTPITVRLYLGAHRDKQVDSGTVGTVYNDTVYSLLADEFADIRAGTDVTDSFNWHEEKYIIGQIVPNLVMGVTVGYQAILERVM